jgi:hypothetical protein
MSRLGVLPSAATIGLYYHSYNLTNLISARIVLIRNQLGRVPLIVQISTLVIKYWIRIEAPNFMNTLVGEAASFNIRANSQAVSFTNYIIYIKTM